MTRNLTVTELWVEQPGLRRGYVADVITALLLGGLTIGGGRARTAGHGFDVLNQNGGPALWGTVLVAAGVALVAVSWWRAGAVVAVLIALAGLYALFGLWFLLSALPGGVSWWGPVLCGRCAYMHLSRAWVYYDEGTP